MSTALGARWVDGRVDLSFTLPTKNTNGTTPVALAIESVYALSLDAGEKAPKYETLPKPKNLVGMLEVRPPDASDSSDPNAPEDPRPAPGGVATYSETPPTPGEAKLWADAQARPTRLYTVVGMSKARKQSLMSEPLVVPLGTTPDPPHDVVVTYDHTTLTLTWAGSADAAYRVYAVDHDGKELASKDLPAALLTPSPLSALTFAMPVKFGAEICVAVRAVVVEGTIATESAAALSQCSTPVDTFPPPAPTGLNAVADVGVVQLAWNAVATSDLAGYVILRREVGTETLQRLNPELWTGTNYSDSKVRAGVDYEYVVRAVDNATPPNESPDSEHKIVTARVPHTRDRE